MIDLPMTYWQEAIDLDARGLVHRALDVLLLGMDEALRAGRFAECDQILLAADCGCISSTLLVALLSMTVPAERRLTARAEFFRRAWHELTIRGRPAAKLIGALEHWQPMQ
jgi:hypothetical protein